jgi:integrase
MPAVAYIREVKPSTRHPQPRWRVYHETRDGEAKVGIYPTLRQAEQVRDRVNRYGLDAVLGATPGEAGASASTSAPSGASAARARTPFGQYVRDRWWPAWKAAHPDSEQHTRYRLNKRVLPRFGDIPLGELDADTIGLWKGDMLGEGLAPRTINTYISLVGTILNAAVDSGYLDRSPLLRRSGAGRAPIVRNVPVDKREVWLTREQLDRLVAALPPRYRALAVTAALTGLRWGELTALRWWDLRLDTPLNDGAVAGVGRVRITKAISDPKRTGRGREKAPKTRAGRREIALDQETVTALTAHRQLVDDGADQLVFTSAGGARGKGGRLASNNFARIWKKALDRAELTGAWPEYGGLRFHDLRHTHATWLIARQVPPIAVAKRLGHASPVVTMMVYAHVTELVQAGTLTTGDLGLTGPAPVVPLRPVQAPIN